MHQVCRILSVLFLLALTGAVALANGFAINEHGARAMAQGGAFAARASDPSALFFNPAGITRLTGTRFYAGMTLIQQQSTWAGNNLEIQSDDKLEIPPHFQLTQQLSKRWFFGMAFSVPFGLSKRWPDSFPGKYSSQLVNLHVFNFNPALAVQATDRISLGAGVSVIRAQARLDRALYLQDLSNQYFGGFPLADGYFSAKVDDYAFGWNAGVQVKLAEKAFLGFSYRSQAELELTGNVTLSTPSTGVAAIDATLRSLFPSQEAETRVNLPDVLFVGIGGSVTENLELEMDVQWTNWHDYHDLPFTFAQPTAAVRNTTVLKDWDNACTLRWGTEYHLNKQSDVRAGFLYDLNPVPDATLDPMLPDSNRLSFQAGYGWQGEHWIFDLAYMYLHFREREIHNDPALHIVPGSGSYRSHAHMFGISLGYRF